MPAGREFWPARQRRAPLRQPVKYSRVKVQDNSARNLETYGPLHADILSGGSFTVLFMECLRTDFYGVAADVTSNLTSVYRTSVRPVKNSVEFLRGEENDRGVSSIT
jgi:hypothetical protein